MSKEFTYFEDGQIDRVMGLIWQVTQEVYVLRQRTLALEELLVQKGIFVGDELDTASFSEESQNKMTESGLDMMTRLLRTISEVDDSDAPLRKQFEEELSGARSI